MANRVPQTLVKLSQSLSIIAFHQVDDTANPFDSLNLANIVNTLASLKVIGATFGFRVNQTRENYQRRGIGSPMEAFAITPGPVTTNIEMDRVSLYSQDAMGAFQFLPGNIAFQTRPLVILETIFEPQDRSGRSLSRQVQVESALGRGLPSGILASILSLVDIAKTPTYTGCWLSESSIKYKLESNQVVMQNVTLNVARISPAVGVVFPQIEEILVRNLPLATRGIELARKASKLIR